MQIGAWRSYDELEESMTIDELFELYRGIMLNRVEDFKNMARANGAKINDDEDGEKDPDAFNRVMDEVRRRKGEQPQEKNRQQQLGLFSIKQI